ncbi:MAG: hypothetical protein ACREML_09330, partial [Vulcanimicrobiaceae bacterium]
GEGVLPGRRFPVMDISSVSSIAANGTSSVALPVLKGVENLQAVQADILMASLGVGTTINTYA